MNHARQQLIPRLLSGVSRQNPDFSNQHEIATNQNNDEKGNLSAVCGDPLPGRPVGHYPAANNAEADVTGRAARLCGTLQGNNTTIGGSVTVKSGATFYAGFASNALGTLTLDKDLTLEAGSLTIAAINPDLSPSSDVINVNGTLHYGGTLVVYSIGHTNALMAGEAFTVFPNGGLGSFDNVIFNSIETQPGTTLSFDGATGVVTVTATTAPSLNLAALGVGLMQINWDSSFYKLQWQTNALNTGLNLNWTDYPTTNKASVNVTNDLTIPATFFRLAPLP